MSVSLEGGEGEHSRLKGRGTPGFCRQDDAGSVVGGGGAGGQRRPDHCGGRPHYAEAFQRPVPPLHPGIHHGVCS